MARSFDPADGHRQAQSSGGRPSWRGSVAVTAVVVAMLGVLGGGVALLHLRAAADTPVAAQPPLPVAVVAATRVDGYHVRERFAGRLEAARATELAFERAGLVAEVLVDEGDVVRAGQVVGRLDVAALRAQRDRLRAERAAAIANLELARLTEARQQDLAAKGHSSTQRYDEARLATRALEAGLGEVDAAIEAIEIDLAKSELRAPFTGIIAARMIDEGTVVAAGTPLLRHLENGRPQARIGLSPTAAATLKPGDRVELRAGERRLPAALISLRPDLTTGTRTVEALFSVDDAAGVPFGEVIELTTERRVDTSGFWLPRDTLDEGPKGLWTVLTAVDGPGGAVVGREAVEVLHLDGDRVFVRGTLGDGTQVVAGGSHRIIPGQAIAPISREDRS